MAMIKLPLPRIVCDVCPGTCVYMKEDGVIRLQCLKCEKQWHGPHIGRAVDKQDAALDKCAEAVHTRVIASF